MEANTLCVWVTALIAAGRATGRAIDPLSLYHPPSPLAHAPAHWLLALSAFLIFNVGDGEGDDLPAARLADTLQCVCYLRLYKVYIVIYR